MKHKEIDLLVAKPGTEILSKEEVYSLLELTTKPVENALTEEDASYEETEVLSKEEINQLIAVISKGSEVKDEGFKLYDFKEPDLISKKVMKEISRKFSMIASKIATRENVIINLSMITTLSRKDYLKSITSTAYIYRVDIPDLNCIILEMENTSLVSSISKILTDTFGGVSNSYNDISEEFRFRDFSKESFTLLDFEVVGDNKEYIFSMLVETRKLVSWITNENKVTKETKVFNKGKIETVIEASLGKTTWTLDKINSIESGTIIKLDRVVGDSVPIFIDGQEAGTGEVVLVDEVFAVRVIKMFEEK